MDLAAVTGLQITAGQGVVAAKMNDHFKPVHSGAHSHFVKVGYMHTGNKIRGGITSSEYFKTKGGNSRSVSVMNDGSYIKTSRTAKGSRRRRGRIDGKGMKSCYTPQMENAGDVKKPAAAGKPEGEQVDHMGEYKRLMQESQAHQRAADASNQSHQDADRGLYEQHAGKAWRLGNQAMKHYYRLTKEQRSMLRDQHWQTSQPQPAAGAKKKIAADWDKFNNERGSKGGKGGGLKKGDWVTHPITKARGQVNHVYKDNANEKGHLVEVDYGNRTVNHREANLSKSADQTSGWAEKERED